MIADRHPLVVRQQRVVGAEQLADVGRVMDADIEVGVVADRRRQVQRAVGGLSAAGGSTLPCSARARREQLDKPSAQGPARARTKRQQRVQSVGPAAASAACRASPSSSPRGKSAARSRISSPIATPPRGPPPGGLNTPKRQVLDREVGMAVGRGDPAAAFGIVRGVGHRILSAARAGSGRSASCSSLPVVAVVLLQLLEPGGVGGDPLREAGLEHEGHGALELVRLQLGVARTLERVAVGAVRQHDVVQRAAARHEALRLGVVLRRRSGP